MAGRPTIYQTKPAAERVSPAPPRPTRAWLEWLLPAACCLVLFAQLMLSVRHLSQTADESTHLYSGYRALRCGDYGVSCEHPPLAKLVAAVPLFAGRVPLDCRSTRRDDAFAALSWLYGHDWQTVLARSRMTVSLFAAALCLLMWIAARQMFGFTTAAVATLLLVFEPNVLAHGALVTTDMVVTFTLFLAIYTFYLWTRKRSTALFLLSGVAIGLTLIAKQSGVIVVPLVFVLAVVDVYLEAGDRRPRRKAAMRNLLAAALMCVIAVGVVWGAYRFRFSAYPNGQHLPSYFDRRGSGTEVLVAARDYHLLPQAYLEGLQRARMLARGPAPVFMLGRMYARARWFFFPALFLIKLTLASLMLLAAGVIGLSYVFPRQRREVLFLAIPALVFLLACMSSRMPPAIRHAMPMSPFVLVLAAAGIVALARRFRWAAYGIPIALVLHAASSLHAFPHYLSYSNELWGGPSQTYKYVPGNDWGEGYKEARQYLAARGNPPCWLASPYQMDIAPYRVPCRQFLGGTFDTSPIPPKVHGVVIVSSTFFSNPFFNFWIGPFRRLQPTAHLAGSAMLVYEGDVDTTLPAIVSELAAARRGLRDGRASDAVEHARQAVAYDASNGSARYEYCRALVASDDYARARRECAAARELLSDRGPSDALATAGRHLADAEEALATGRPADALRAARQAVEVAPESGAAQAEYCRVLHVNGLTAQATQECTRARAIMLRNAGANDVNEVASAAFRIETPYFLSKLDRLDLLLYSLGEKGSPATYSRRGQAQH